MRLSVPERLKLLEMLPEKSSYEGIVEIRRLSMLLMLTGEEAEEIDVKHLEGGVTSWNQEKAIALITDIPMGEWVTNVIRKLLKEKDDEGDLDLASLSLFEKFIMDYA